MSNAATRSATLSEGLLLIAICIAWLAGVVLAAGWWKLLAVTMPLYAWYLVIERAMVGACV